MPVCQYKNIKKYNENKLYLALAASLLLSMFCPALLAHQIQVIDQHGEPVNGALVAISSPAIAAMSYAPTEHLMDQVDKRFVPDVIAIRKGDAINFPNSDNIRHHVYSFSVPRSFEIPLYAGEPTNPVVFQEAGLVIVGCNIHDRMQGFIHIVDQSFFALTDTHGIVRFEKLPDEELTVTVKHHYALAEIGMTVSFDRQLLSTEQVIQIDMDPPRELSEENGLSELEKKFMKLRHH